MKDQDCSIVQNQILSPIAEVVRNVDVPRPKSIQSSSDVYRVSSMHIRQKSLYTTRGLLDRMVSRRLK